MGQVPLKKSDPISGLSRWLLHSGTQNLSRDPKKRGGFAAWYEIDRDLYPFLYSEITGYALTTLVFLNSFSPDRLQIRRAELAADWLMRCARLPKGGVKTRYYLVKDYETPNYSFHHGRVYTFDTAIVAYGALQLYKATQKKRYLDWAWEMTHFMLQKMRRPDGLFHAYYDSVPARTGEDLEKWSDQAGSFHAKLALHFTDLWRITRDPRLKRTTCDLLDASLGLQRREGRFITNLGDGSTHLHPHCYTMEGIVYAAFHMELKKYLKPLKKAMLWTLTAVGEDGSISTMHKDGQFDFHERSDIVAQVLRMGSILYAMGVCRDAGTAVLLKKIREHLALFLYPGKSDQRGGMLYGAATDGRVRVHLNTWCAMFALQAFRYHDQYVIAGKELELEHLI